jgi:hypothetical protein
MDVEQLDFLKLLTISKAIGIIWHTNSDRGFLLNFFRRLFPGKIKVKHRKIKHVSTI